MASIDYDIVVVGGGIAGAAFAGAAAQAGIRVLVLERETNFRDRVRGEWTFPWGVAELERLGLGDIVRQGGGNEITAFETRMNGAGTRRDLPSTTGAGLPGLTFYHPRVQETLLAHAADMGVEVRRGAHVTSLQPGEPPTVSFTMDGSEVTIASRLVVGADGRSSTSRQAIAGQEQQRQNGRLIAGVLLELKDGAVPMDTAVAGMNFERGSMGLMFPQGGQRARVYAAYRAEARERLSGAAALDELIEEAVAAGLDADVFADAQVSGPLATFEGYDTWIDHPYAGGIALVGDAAGLTDPTWGQGMSLSWRDARTLLDALLEHDDWEQAGQHYARTRAEYFRRVTTVERWVEALFLDPGPEGEARRAQALPRIAEDPTRMPDHPFSGPDLPLDDSTHDRLFGLD